MGKQNCRKVIDPFHSITFNVVIVYSIRKAKAPHLFCWRWVSDFSRKKNKIIKFDSFSMEPSEFDPISRLHKSLDKSYFSSIFFCNSHAVKILIFGSSCYEIKFSFYSLLSYGRASEPRKPSGLSSCSWILACTWDWNVEATNFHESLKSFREVMKSVVDILKAVGNFFQYLIFPISCYGQRNCS